MYLATDLIWCPKRRDRVNHPHGQFVSFCCFWSYSYCSKKAFPSNLQWGSQKSGSVWNGNQMSQAFPTSSSEITTFLSLTFEYVDQILTSYHQMLLLKSSHAHCISLLNYLPEWTFLSNCKIRRTASFFISVSSTGRTKTEWKGVSCQTVHRESNYGLL